MTHYRYIELNPVRAGMVGDANGYRWSSYGAHALGQADELIRDHSCYWALGATGWFGELKMIIAFLVSFAIWETWNEPAQNEMQTELISRHVTDEKRFEFAQKNQKL